MKAEYKTRCSECKYLIFPGEEITSSATGWMHEECLQPIAVGSGKWDGSDLDSMGY